MLNNNNKFIDNFPPVIYHYCTMENFCKIFATDTLKLTNITKSNDPQEVIYVREHLNKVLKYAISRFNRDVSEESIISNNAIEDELEQYFDEHNPSKVFYAICFSESQNKLSQWEKYADHSSGVAIGFDARILNNLQTEESDYMFGPITYGKDKIEKSLYSIVDDFFETHCNDSENYAQEFTKFLHNAVIAISKHAPLFKSDFFKEEQEWRLIYSPKRIVSRIAYKNFHDLRLEVDQTANERINGIRRSMVKYEGKSGKLRSYIELDFSDIRDKLIREIILGPQADIDPYDLDLEWLLDMKGYKRSGRGETVGLKVIKVSDKLRNF